METKTVAAVMLALACAAAAVQAFADDGLPAAAAAWLAERREIVFAGQEAYPPFEFIDERSGEYAGMAIELIRWIATEYGFTAVFKPMTFQDAQDAVLQGRADALTGFFRSDDRSIRYDFTSPVFSVSSSVFARIDRADIRSEADIEGKRVAVQRGDYAVEYLASAKKPVEFIYTDDFRSALAFVASGKADALIGDEETVQYYVYQEGLGDAIMRASGVLYVGQDCMAVAKGDAMLLAVLDAGIARAKATGTLDTIYRKWTGSGLAVTPRKPSATPGLALAIVGAVLSSALALAMWLRGRTMISEATATLAAETVSLRAENSRLKAESAELRRDLEERSRLEEDKRRIDAEAAARRVEELTRCAIAKALDPGDSRE